MTHVAGILLAIVGFYSAWRAINYARGGRAFVFSDLSGRGVGSAEERKNGSAWFWFVFISDLLASLGAVIFGTLLLKDLI